MLSRSACRHPQPGRSDTQEVWLHTNLLQQMRESEDSGKVNKLINLTESTLSFKAPIIYHKTFAKPPPYF